MGNFVRTEDTMKMGNTEKKKLMTIKRYLPKYKIFSRFRQPLIFEKRKKINKFSKKKWDSIKKYYFPTRHKSYRQDVSTYLVGKTYDEDKTIRLKKTYKFLLQEKQRFQFYYGMGRLKLFQLKKLAKEALSLSGDKNLSVNKIFFHLLESRLDIALCRLSLVSTLMQSRRAVNSGSIEINGNTVLFSKKQLSNGDFVRIDPFLFSIFLARYLKFHTPFFYFKSKKVRRRFIFEREDSINSFFFKINSFSSLEFLKTKLLDLKYVKKNKSLPKSKKKLSFWKVQKTSK